METRGEGRRAEGFSLKSIRKLQKKNGGGVEQHTVLFMLFY